MVENVKITVTAKVNMDYVVNELDLGDESNEEIIRDALDGLSLDEIYDIMDVADLDVKFEFE